MPFHGAAEFLSLFKDYRVVYVTGRYGGGKTSVCMALAKYFHETEGYRIVSTASTLLAGKEMPRYETGKGVHAVLVLDEAGLWFRKRSDFDGIAAYAAKLDLLVLIPSVVPPHEQFQSFVLQPSWSLRSLGIPVIRYVWSISYGAVRVQGGFWWSRPSEIWPYYRRGDPATALGVREMIESWAQALQADYGRTDKIGIDFGEQPEDLIARHEHKLGRDPRPKAKHGYGRHD